MYGPILRAVYDGLLCYIGGNSMNASLFINHLSIFQFRSYIIKLFSLFIEYKIRSIKTASDVCGAVLVGRELVRSVHLYPECSFSAR